MYIQNVHQNELNDILSKPRQQVNGVSLVRENNLRVLQFGAITDNQCAQAHREEYSNNGSNNIYIQAMQGDKYTYYG